MNAIQTLAAEPWVGRLGWALIHFLWQGGLIASVYAIARIGMIQPRVRYFLACGALLAMIAAPVATFVRDVPSGSVPYHAAHSRAQSSARSEWSTAPIASSADPGRSSWLDSVMPWFVTAWFAGTVMLWLRFTAECILVTRIRSTSASVAGAEWQRTIEKLGARIRISRPVRLLTSSRVEVPAVIGWLRPVVLMPVGALAGLPIDHIEALLAHELAHIRRHDYVVNILQRVAEAALFYHPAVWWISGQIRQEREHCCDDIAASITGDTVAYVEALADLEASRPARLGPALAANGGSLESRIARLLGVRDRQIPRASVLGAVLGVFFFMLVAALAQSAASEPRFEVASIKPSPPEYVGFQSYVRGDRYTALTATVRNLMSYAYGIRDFQITGGPAWTSSVGYNISAKMPTAAGTGRDSSKLMMQALLAARFGLKFHRITKDRAGYALVIDKSGPKLVESKNPGPGLGLGRGRLMGRGSDMLTLARELSSQLEAPIADRTGLGARYDFTLIWSPDDQVTDSAEPSVFSAIREQLGLRLDPVKDVPVEFFVIDSVNKPSEN